MKILFMIVFLSFFCVSAKTTVNPLQELPHKLIQVTPDIIDKNYRIFIDCFCSGSSMKIDASNKKLFIYNICSNFKDDDTVLKFSIISVRKESKKYTLLLQNKRATKTIYLNELVQGLYRLDVQSDGLSQGDTKPVYLMEFTKHLEKVEEECGDFDG